MTHEAGEELDRAIAAQVFGWQWVTNPSGREGWAPEGVRGVDCAEAREVGMPYNVGLVEQSQALLERIRAAIAACWHDDPRHGPVITAGQERRHRRLRQVEHRARRRRNRRMAVAGLGLPPVAMRETLINERESDWF